MCVWGGVSGSGPQRDKHHLPQSPFTGQFFLDDDILHCILWVLSFYVRSYSYIFTHHRSCFLFLVSLRIGIFWCISSPNLLNSYRTLTGCKPLKIIYNLFLMLMPACNLFQFANLYSPDFTPLFWDKRNSALLQGVWRPNFFLMIFPKFSLYLSLRDLVQLQQGMRIKYSFSFWLVWLIYL